MSVPKIFGDRLIESFYSVVSLLSSHTCKVEHAWRGYTEVIDDFARAHAGTVGIRDECCDCRLQVFTSLHGGSQLCGRSFAQAVDLVLVWNVHGTERVMPPAVNTMIRRRKTSRRLLVR